MSCCLAVYRWIGKVIFPPGITPLSWRIHGTIFVVLISSAMTVTMLFPFLPHMVKGFGYSDEETGYYAGVVASAMFFGRFFGSYLWGWLSDKFGRKPILIGSLICLSVSTLAFGFTFSLAWAVTTRFLVGLSNGIVGNCKALLTETSDSTNQAIAMAVLSASWSAGMVIGPGIGGYLAEPVRQFPASFAKGSFFDKFAFLLPCLVNTAIMLVAMVMLHVFFPKRVGHRLQIFADDISGANNQSVNAKEDGPKKTNGVADSIPDLTFENGGYITSTDVSSGTVEYHSSSNHLETRLASSKKTPTTERENDLGLQRVELHERLNFSIVPDLQEENHAGDDLQKTKLCGSDSNREENYDDSIALLDEQDDRKHGTIVIKSDSSFFCSCCRTDACNDMRDTTIWKLLRNRDVQVTIANYCVFSFVVIGFDELYNIWAATEPRLGGLGFTSDQIGTTLLLAGVMMMAPQIFCFHKSEKKFGVVKTFQGWATVAMFLAVVISCLGSIHDRRLVLWPTLTGMLFIMRVACSCCFCASSIFINNAVPLDQLGSVNGLAMSLTSLLRTFSPMFCGSIFAWSITTGVKIGFPFDEHFAFLSLGLILLFVLILSTRLPDRVNRLRGT